MGVYNVDGLSIGSSIFVSVADYGAKGDGSTDDSAAIQTAIDSVKTSGGTIYFPEGTYVVNTMLRFYSNQRFLFESNSTMTTSNSSLDALMVGYVADTVEGYEGIKNVVFYGGDFRRGSRSAGMTLVAVSHGYNIVFENCKFNSTGAWHNAEINSSKHCKVINCYFEGSAKANSNSCCLQLDSIGSSSNFPWDHVGAIDGTACDDIEIIGCLFENCSTAPFIGSHTNSGTNARIHECVFENNTSTRGAIQFYSLTNLDVYNNTFTDCTNGVSFSNSGESSCSVHDNRFSNATTAIETGITAYNNWINGTFTS